MLIANEIRSPGEPHDVEIHRYEQGDDVFFLDTGFETLRVNQRTCHRLLKITCPDLAVAYSKILAQTGYLGIDRKLDLFQVRRLQVVIGAEIASRR